MNSKILKEYKNYCQKTNQKECSYKALKEFMKKYKKEGK